MEVSVGSGRTVFMVLTPHLIMMQYTCISQQKIPYDNFLTIFVWDFSTCKHDFANAGSTCAISISFMETRQRRYGPSLLSHCFCHETALLQ